MQREVGKGKERFREGKGETVKEKAKKKKGERRKVKERAKATRRIEGTEESDQTFYKVRLLYLYTGKLWNKEENQEKFNKGKEHFQVKEKKGKKSKIQLKVNFNDVILQWICAMFDSRNGDNCFHWNQMKIQMQIQMQSNN